MTGFEIFAGVGGMSVGAKFAGVNVKLAIEIDNSAATTYKFNHSEAIVLNTDIRKVKSIPHIQIKDKKLLFGGPPCQGFSTSNQRTRNINNENNWLFEEFIRMTKLWQPDFIVFENVSGLLVTESGYFLEQILKKFKRLGYHTDFSLLNSYNFGVPQKRERLFIVGFKEKINFKFPEPIKEAYSVFDALHDLPSLENGDSFETKPYKSEPKSKYAHTMRKKSKNSLNNFVTKNSDLIIERYKYIPQGGNWQYIPKRLMKNYQDYTRCHGGIYHRLHENEPSIVIGNYRKNMLIHPKENRGLSVREAARLQSFPDWFEFKGQLTSQQQQVGNAVPPLLSKAVFSALVKQTS
jgi:DNA (cytosine-5)-methyltransferase 1